MKQTKRYAGEDKGRKAPIVPENMKHYWVRFPGIDLSTPEPALYDRGHFYVCGGEIPMPPDQVEVIALIKPPK